MQSNNERLRRVAEGLGPLGDRIVFVGGCVAQLYANDEAAIEIRPTLDVDCVVDLSSYSDYNAFSELLRERNFHNSMRPGDPICRWTFEDEIVDFMPFEDSPIGPSNQWYKPGMQHRIVYEVSKGLTIYVLPVIYYVATKLEAVRSRGGDDLRFSHDFEDLVFVLNYSDVFEEQITKSDDIGLKKYMSDSFEMLLKRPYIQEEIMSALPYDERERVNRIKEIMRKCLFCESTLCYYHNAN